MKLKTGFAIAFVSATLFSVNAAQAADPVIGLLLGGAAGSLVGKDVGGRHGAAVGGMIGAAVGVAIANDMNRQSYGPPVAYDYPPAPVYYQQPVVVPVPVYVEHRYRPGRHYHRSRNYRY